VRYNETCAQCWSEFVVPHGRVFNGHRVVIDVILMAFIYDVLLKINSNVFIIKYDNLVYSTVRYGMQ
jgi:hypothetical protein